jgi:polygalacturonase
VSTSFPTSLDSFTVPSGSTPLGAGPTSHTRLHQNTADAVAALQAKVGVDSSAVTTSLDYRVRALEPAALFNVKRYGATGNGTTDDTTAIQAAVTAASVAGGVVYLPAGTYLVSSSISVAASNVYIKGDGRGATRVIYSMTSSGYVFSFAGSLTATLAGATTTLSSDAGPNQASWDDGKTVVVASAAGLAVGDVVLVGDTYDIGMDAQGWADRWRGEYVRIGAIASTTLTLYAPLRDPYTTARTASLWLPTWRSNVGLEGVSIAPNSTALQGTTLVGGAQFSACRSITVRDCDFRNLDNPGVSLGNTFDAKIVGCTMTDLTDDTGNNRYGYGVVVGSSESTIVANCEFRRVRHGVTTGASNGRVGWCRNLLVTGCLAEETTSTGFDTHPHTTDVVFVGNRVDRVLSHGIQVRSERTRVFGNDISRVKFDAVRLDLGDAIDVEIADNRIYEPGRYGVNFSGDATDGYPSYVTVRDNLIHEAYDSGIRVASPIVGLRVLQNVVIDANQNAPTSGQAISLNVPGGGLDGARFIGNIASGVQATAQATGGTVSNSVFMDNRLTGGVGTTPDAVRGTIITAGTGNSVHGNGTNTTLTTNTQRVNGTMGINAAPGASTNLAIGQASDASSVSITNTNASGNTNTAAVAFSSVTAASLAESSRVTGEAQSRFVRRSDGRMDWGDGTNARDTNLYRKAAGQLGTDDSVFLANQGSAPATPTGGGVLYVSGGALLYKGSSGTVTPIAPA